MRRSLRNWSYRDLLYFRDRCWYREGTGTCLRTVLVVGEWCWCCDWCDPELQMMKWIFYTEMYWCTHALWWCDDCWYNNNNHLKVKLIYILWPWKCEPSSLLLSSTVVLHVDETSRSYITYIPIRIQRLPQIKIPAPTQTLSVFQWRKFLHHSYLHDFRNMFARGIVENARDAQT